MSLFDFLDRRPVLTVLIIVVLGLIIQDVIRAAAGSCS